MNSSAILFLLTKNKHAITSKAHAHTTKRISSASPSTLAQSFAVVFALQMAFHVSRMFGSIFSCAMPKRDKDIARVEVASLNGRTIITGGQMPQSLA